MAAVFWGVQIEDLSGRGRAPDIVRAREIIATLGVERYGLRVKDIAAAFEKNAEAASRMVSRGIEKRQHDRDFRNELEALDRYLPHRPERPPTTQHHK